MRTLANGGLTAAADLAPDVAEILRGCAREGRPALSAAQMYGALRDRGIATRESWVLKAMRAFYETPPAGVETRVKGRVRHLRCRRDDGSWTDWTPGATRDGYGAGQGYNDRPGRGEIIIDPVRLWRAPQGRPL